MGNFCAILICNSSPNPMELVASGQQYGRWMQGPDQSIPANTQSRMILADDDPVHGPNGFVTYKVTDKGGTSGQIKFFFSCPLLESNVVDWVWDPKPDPHPDLTAIYCARAGDVDIGLQLNNVWLDGAVQGEGNPVTGVYFVIEG